MRDNQSVRSVPNFYPKTRRDPHFSHLTLNQQYSNGHSRMIHNSNIGYWKDKVLP